MDSTKRPLVFAANWKMNKTIGEAIDYVYALRPLVKTSPNQILLGVPFTVLRVMADYCQGSNLIPGAQNMYEKDEGAFTGEISGKMLLDAGAKFVILGHSERRGIFHESNEFVNQKLKKAVEIGLKPIVCIGETGEEREQGHTTKVLTHQLKRSLEGLDPTQIGDIMLAYEPLWAIGTNNTATPAVSQDVHLFCRRWISKEFGEKAADKIVILYGGSVRPDNAAAILEQKDIDGVLVGTASLSAESFGKIVNCLETKHLNFT
jgi:triosephosphate isomerase (TIM)